MEPGSDWGWSWGKIAKMIVMIAFTVTVIIVVGYFCFLGYEWTQNQRTSYKLKTTNKLPKHVTTRHTKAMPNSQARRGTTTMRAETNNMRQAPHKKRIRRHQNHNMTNTSSTSRSRSPSNNKKKKRVKRKKVIQLKSGSLDNFSRCGLLAHY